jgi:hypothetical protein
MVSQPRRPQPEHITCGHVIEISCKIWPGQLYLTQLHIWLKMALEFVYIDNKVTVTISQFVSYFVKIGRRIFNESLKSSWNFIWKRCLFLFVSLLQCSVVTQDLYQFSQSFLWTILKLMLQTSGLISKCIRVLSLMIWLKILHIEFHSGLKTPRVKLFIRWN